MHVTNFDGPAVEYTRFSSEGKSSAECTNACLLDPRCMFAVQDSRFCYLKDLPVNQGTCADSNGCWVLKSNELTLGSLRSLIRVLI
jgi:hypothetical protein